MTDSNIYRAKMTYTAETIEEMDQTLVVVTDTNGMQVARLLQADFDAQYELIES